ncbi:esterase [Mycobacterium sp. IS-1496]|uniref:alpha/beta hydrolase family protein n=1 Tax=Mycobacterium sp. IS-1496 TaxID=1772284 RepID=UPI0007415449|nr:alpha/beta hydrolase [Mycobacterium sp. IS-1496]KUI36940.1 esterase [Mycobacterium sp. IS-1496]
METLEYAPGRSLDLYGEEDAPVVLLWHGMQTDSRAAVRPLGERVAELGLAVVAPDWNSHADDSGRSDLLNSARFAAGRSGAADGLVVVGWSLGGAAAVGLTFRAAEYGLRITRTVCLAGAFMAPDPLSGEPLTPRPAAGARVPVTLVHGGADDVVPASVSRDFTAEMGVAGWRVQYIELAADHANIVGARYDAGADRYEPSDDPASLAVAAEVARIVAEPAA